MVGNHERGLNDARKVIPEGPAMGFIDNALHPDRKRQEIWRRFSSEAGGFFVSDGESGGGEVHIPFMGRQINVGTKFEGRKSRTVLTIGYPTDDL
jgi:hypothetical protein